MTSNPSGWDKTRSAVTVMRKERRKQKTQIRRQLYDDEELKIREKKKASEFPTIENTKMNKARFEITRKLMWYIKNQQEKVAAYIEENAYHIDKDVKDPAGNTLLECAVKSKDIEMVKQVVALNFSKSKLTIPIEDGLLHAIEENEMDMVKEILPLLLKEGGVKFPTVTPFMKAAIHERYEIMQHLSDLAAKGPYEIESNLLGELPTLHMASCKCGQDGCNAETCKPEKKEKNTKPTLPHGSRCLEATERRINILKAQASPTYMIWKSMQDGSYDPVWEAFQLSKKLKDCIELEPEYKKEYEEIKKKVEKLPADLIGLCWTAEETKIFLSPRQGYHGPIVQKYPRLIKACEREQKVFVAHPNAQFLMEDEFYGHVHKDNEIWNRTRTRIVRLVIVTASPLLQFFLAVGLILCGCGSACPNKVRMARFLLSPINRALMKLGINIYICIFMVLEALDCGNGPMQECYMVSDAWPQTWYVWYCTFAWALGVLFAIFRQASVNGGIIQGKRWSLYDMIMSGFIIASYCIRFYMIMMNDDRKYTDMHRGILQYDHPLLLSECCFGVGSFMAVLRLSRWFMLFEFFGQFQTAFSNIGKQTWTVIFLMMWILLTFCISTRIIYAIHKDVKAWDADANKAKKQTMDFTKFESLFLHAFGMGEGFGPGNVKLLPYNSTISVKTNETLIANASSSQPRTTVEVEKQVVAESSERDVANAFLVVMVLVFNIVVMTFLKDSLIGLFSSSALEVLKNKDLEYNFARMREWIYYIQDSTLSPPFNLVPNVRCCRSLKDWNKNRDLRVKVDKVNPPDDDEWGERLCSCCSFCHDCYYDYDGDEEAQWKTTEEAQKHRENNDYVEDEEAQKHREILKIPIKVKEYHYLMRKLFQRYFQLQRFEKWEKTKPRKKDVKKAKDKAHELLKLLGGGRDKISPKASPIMSTATSEYLNPSIVQVFEAARSTAAPSATGLASSGSGEAVSATTPAPVSRVPSGGAISALVRSSAGVPAAPVSKVPSGGAISALVRSSAGVPAAPVSTSPSGGATPASVRNSPGMAAAPVSRSPSGGATTASVRNSPGVAASTGATVPASQASINRTPSGGPRPTTTATRTLSSQGQAQSGITRGTTSSRGQGPSTTPNRNASRRP